MTSLKTRIQKLREVWSKRHRILEGLKNYILKTEHAETISRTRMDICRECPLIDLKGASCFAPGTQPCCSSCGCSLEFKTRSLEDSCPEGKW
jgi:hypothetical protein